MNGMCVKNKNIYAWLEQAIIREIATHDLYCCLLPRCKALLIGISDRNNEIKYTSKNILT